ncbi:hypothetical protein PQX77_001368 [Marasmius sp. AFHP31]|nr:hypothetical protein PQX77_001368 [Marasmius sp. AFHP31]
MANPDEFTLISLIGQNLYMNGIGLLTTAIAYGIYAVLFCFAVVILCRNEGKPRAKFFLLLAVFSMFTISTFFVAAYASIFFEEIQMILIDHITEPVANKIISYQERFTHLSLVQQVMFFVEVVIGDFVVVWRAWALWSENRKVIIVPVLLLSGSAASMLSFLGCFVHHGWLLPVPLTCSAFDISTYVLSMATNVASTAAIAYKVWIHRRVVKKYFITNSYGMGAEKALVLLMESGMIYSLLWILQLISFIPSVGETHSGQITRQVFNSISVQLVGIYPTLVILLVYLQRSLWDPSGSGSRLAESHSTN